jgi:hypothetical protein
MSMNRAVALEKIDVDALDKDYLKKWRISYRFLREATGLSEVTRIYWLLLKNY